MVALHTSNIDIAYFKKRIEQKTNHTYLHKYIEKPTIDEEKLLILISIMDGAILSTEQKERYIITTMLVQLALDTHDKVSVDDILDTRTKSQIPNQLTVLAGDYYSGLYYFLLSEIDDFELIHVLATAIKEINEQKMNLYYRERLSPEEFIYIIKQIETLLFTHVSDHIGTEPLDGTIAEWFAINKLTIEKNKTTSPLIDVWRTNCDHQQRCSEQAWNDLMDARMTHLKTSITSQNRHHIPSMIKERLYEYKMSDVEEG